MDIPDFVDAMIEKRVRLLRGRGWTIFELDDYRQECLVAVLQALPRFDPTRGTTIHGYLSSVISRRTAYSVRTRSQQMLRQDYQDVMLCPSGHDGQPTSWSKEQPDSSQLETQVISNIGVEEILNEFTGVDRKLLVLLLAGHTYAEVSRALGVAKSIVTRRIKVVRERLRERTGR